VRIPLTYEFVAKNYPDQVAQVVNNLRKSRSKNKDTQAENLEWAFVDCFQLGFDLKELGWQRIEIDGNAYGRDHGTAEQRYNHIKANIFVSLTGSVGRSQNFSSVITPVPGVVKQEYIAEYENEIVECDREDSLSSSQREESINDLLGKLSKDPGFFVLDFPTDREH